MTFMRCKLIFYIFYFIQELAYLHTTIERIDRQLVAICVQCGVQIHLPVQLPMGSKEDMIMLNDWLSEDTSNADTLVCLTNTDIQFLRMFLKLSICFF